MRIIDCRNLSMSDYTEILPRGVFDVSQATQAVEPICEAVRTQGAEAILKYSQQFDGVVPDQLRVDPAIAQQYAEQLDPQLRQAMDLAISRRREVCEHEALPDKKTVTFAGGGEVTIKSIPVNRVGLYVPGGLAPLASSVLMNVIPAQAARVPSLAIATPPGPDGLPHPTILALCHLLGVDEIYAVGGAQAIAMFAYGVEGLCDKVDMITGPGNIYVVAAKRLLKGIVGIDSEAGPTEIGILADETAVPRFVAADLLSQAEHDEQAGSVLVTTSEELVERVEQELSAMVSETRHRDRITTALAGPQSAIMIVRDLDQGIDVVNAYGAEHLEIHTANPSDVAERITNAGAIFVGDYSPVSLGDYSAGSTHVLPTSGTASHSSGLTARAFYKTVHVINYSQQGLAEISSGVESFALAEDLPGHAQAITVRRDNG